MAGRGRGRGGASMTFDVGSLGFGRGEAMPAAILQPPPAYPPLVFKPTPLSNTEVDGYLLALKQEFRQGMKDSAYYIKENLTKKDISRYSDKFKEAQRNGAEYTPDKHLFPKELIQTSGKKRKVKVQVKPNIPSKKPSKAIVDKLKDTDTLEILEKIIEEKVVEETEDVKEGDEVEEEEYFEEEEEEENDYLVNYDDEGEDDVGMEDDDADEGPVY